MNMQASPQLSLGRSLQLPMSTSPAATSRYRGQSYEAPIHRGQSASPPPQYFGSFAAEPIVRATPVAVHSDVGPYDQQHRQLFQASTPQCQARQRSPPNHSAPRGRQHPDYAGTAVVAEPVPKGIGHRQGRVSLKKEVPVEVMRSAPVVHHGAGLAAAAAQAAAAMVTHQGCHRGHSYVPHGNASPYTGHSAPAHSLSPQVQQPQPGTAAHAAAAAAAIAAAACAPTAAALGSGSSGSGVCSQKTLPPCNSAVAACSQPHPMTMTNRLGTASTPSILPSQNAPNSGSTPGVMTPQPPPMAVPVSIAPPGGWPRPENNSRQNTSRTESSARDHQDRFLQEDRELRLALLEMKNDIKQIKQSSRDATPAPPDRTAEKKMSEDLDRSISENARLMQQNHELRNSNEDLQQQFSSLERSTQEIESRAKTQGQQDRAFANQQAEAARRLEGKSRELTSECERLREELNSMNEEGAAVQQQASVTVQDNKKLQTELQEMRAHNSELQKKLGQQQRQHDDQACYGAEIGRLGLEMKRVESENKTYRRKIDKLKDDLHKAESSGPNMTVEQAERWQKQATANFEESRLVAQLREQLEDKELHLERCTIYIKEMQAGQRSGRAGGC